MCIKFGDKHKACEVAKLQGNAITWVDKIKHLGNYLDTTLDDNVDCQSKSSAFIGFVNKLNVNFGHLQISVLSRLFKTYCCSYYGSQMWRLDSAHFLNVCTTWNRGVRKVFKLPNRTHRWLLGPLLHQQHVSLQLYKRCARFVYGLKQCSNSIVKACLGNALCNANTHP